MHLAGVYILSIWKVQGGGNEVSCSRVEARTHTFILRDRIIDLDFTLLDRNFFSQ